MLAFVLDDSCISSKVQACAEGKVSPLDFDLLLSLLPTSFFCLLSFPFTEHLLGFVLVGSFLKTEECR